MSTGADASATAGSKERIDYSARLKAINGDPLKFADVNKGARDWDVHVYWGAMHGSIKDLRKAVKKGGNINFIHPVNKSTPAHAAAHYQRKKAFKFSEQR